MDKKQPSDNPQAPAPPAATTAMNTSTTAMNTTNTATTTTSTAPQANLSSATLLPSPTNRSADSQTQHHHPTSQPAQPSEPVYPHQINGLGGPTATAPFLRDFSLVAEAASRAQVSVVTRDLEGVSL